MNNKYSIVVIATENLKNYLSNYNTAEDTYFYTVGADEDADKACLFTSSLLDNLEECDDIYNTALQILSIYIGIYRLLDRNKNNTEYLRFGNIILNENHTLKCNARYNQIIYKIDYDLFKRIEKNEPHGDINILFQKIIEDEFLTNLFFLLSQPIDFRMLYIIFDDIKYYLKENECEDFLHGYHTQLSIFTHTSNNYEVLGFYARHGRTSFAPPSNPMSLEDSTDLIFDILVKLLKEKFNIEIPIYYGFNLNTDSENLY